MRIVSTYLPAAFDEEYGKSTFLMGFDTLVGTKNLIVGITVGQIVGKAPEDAKITPIGMKIVARAIRHQELNYPDCKTIAFAGVARGGDALKRVRNLLANSPDKAVLILVCADDKIYDAAFPALNVDHKSIPTDAKKS
jgi:hypothetical protein